MNREENFPKNSCQSEDDPFYSVSNMRQLNKANEQIRKGQTVIKTMTELEKMESDE